MAQCGFLSHWVVLWLFHNGFVRWERPETSILALDVSSVSYTFPQQDRCMGLSVAQGEWGKSGRMGSHRSAPEDIRGVCFQPKRPEKQGWHPIKPNVAPKWLLAVINIWASAQRFTTFSMESQSYFHKWIMTVIIS